VGGRRAGHDRRGFAFAIISRPTDLNGYAQRQRSGRRSGADLGNDQGPSTNSFSSPAVMRPWCGCNLASATGEA